MCVRVLFPESYLIQRLDHFGEELACTCDGSFWCGVEGTTSSGGGRVPACYLFLPHPFQYIFFLLTERRGGKKKGNKNKAPLSEERRGGEQRGHPALSPPGSRLCPAGAGGAGWAGGSRTHAPRPGHARPPPRARAVPPSRAHPAEQLQKKGGFRGNK